MSESSTFGAEDAGPATATEPRIEPRWPVLAAVLLAIVLQVITPHSGRLTIWWVFPIIEILFVLVLVVSNPGRITRYSRASRNLVFALVSVMTIATVIAVVVLLADIINTVKGVTATVLLGRGAAVWVSNIIVFSLWYSSLDRGGPARRASSNPPLPSFAFPENATPELAAEGWTPRYPDYLYLSFTNSTAFSPTDSLPLKTWAKMTLMVQSVLQLMTAILVIARAINVLPG